MRMKNQERITTDKGTIPRSSLMSALGVLLFGSVVPLYSELPISLVVFISLLFGLFLVSQRYPQLRPGRILIFALTLFGIWMVFRQFHTLLGYQAGIAWLAMMLALKLLETHSERDFYVSVILGFFFLVSQFLLNQSMYLAIYGQIIVFGLVAVLVRHNQSLSSSLSDQLKVSGSLFVPAVPLVVIMFLLFPRLNAPLWDLSFGSTQGITGLSDSLAPGSINQLIQSPEPAFRAEFFGPIPHKSELYWRGPIFWNTDGLRWFGEGPSHGQRSSIDPVLVVQGSVYEYRLILEPHGKNWVLALDFPIHAPRSTRVTADLQLVSRKPVMTRQQYLLKSASSVRATILTETERMAALALPSSVGDRTRALVENWKNKSKKKEDIIQTALRHFNSDQFVYTLNPPRLSDDTLDMFLFETQAGFCEHYASAFSILMRMANIPSRVVTGYLGGEYNRLGHYLLVRQSDAHAWSEVWIADRGWIRVDPTAAIAPERVFRQILVEADRKGEPVSFRLDDSGLFRGLIRRIRHSLDAMNTQWHVWVLGYDSDDQNRLLTLVGMEGLDKYETGALMVILVALLVWLIIYLVMRKNRPRPDPVSNLYNKFCNKLRIVGIERGSHEGARDFASRAARLHPDLGTSIKKICGLYEKLRYSGHKTTREFERFRYEVNRFRVKKF